MSITNIIAINFPTNLIHVVYCTLAVASPPITTPDVGVIRFIIPEAALNINTITSGLYFNAAVKGPKTGNATEASPDVDGIKNDNTRNKI